VELDSRGVKRDERLLSRASTALAQLPCPSVALSAGPRSPTARDLVDRFDVVVSSEAELEPVVEAVRRRPLASMALVQLLRHSERLDVHEALVAESLVYSTLQAGPEFAAWLASRGRRAARRESSGQPVLVRRTEGRLELELNRPERRNAFSSAMRDALAEALQVAVADDSIVEVVVKGAGPAFCSGGDLDEFGTLPDPATAHAIRSTRSVARLLAACAGRVRFEVHGACVGAGAELPAFARRVVARGDAFFELPEVGMGLVPGAGGTVSIPRRVGRQRTAYLALTGARLDARSALGWGLVDETASGGEART
jgi:enoyl-CoA hydratase/carnithine racemase